MRPNPYVTCPYGQNSPSLHVFGGRPRPLSNNKSSHSCDAGGGFPATQNTVSQAALTQYGIQTYLWEKRTLTLESKRDSITGVCVRNPAAHKKKYMHLFIRQPCTMRQQQFKKKVCKRQIARKQTCHTKSLGPSSAPTRTGPVDTLSRLPHQRLASPRPSSSALYRHP